MTGLNCNMSSDSKFPTHGVTLAESGAVSIGVRLTTKDSFSGYLKVVSSIPSTGSVTLGYVCW